MITRVRLPMVSANVEEETVTAWLKQEGETVQAGEPLFEVTTEKANVEVEAAASGRLRRILAGCGSMLPVGYIAAVIADREDEPLPDVDTENRDLLDQWREKLSTRPARAQGRRGADEKQRVRATPAARRRARELGVDLAAVKAAVSGDRVSEADVEAFHGRTTS